MEPLGFVFDLDDTLYRETDYVRSCFRWIAPRLGGEGATEKLWALFEKGERDPVGLIAAERGVSESEKAKLVAEMRAHDPAIALDPAAEALIARLRRSGRKFSIVTNGRSVTQRRKIAALGLEDAAAIVISEEFGAAKPDPALFRAVPPKHPAARHLFVGDNPAIDFEGPNALGWSTVMLAREGAVKRAAVTPSPAQRPARTVASLADLQDLL
jgi:putative hydrolase of the HAD superfamily